MRSISESLAGRVGFIDLEGFSLAELGGATSAPPWLGEWLDDPAAFAATKRPRLDLGRTLFEQLWRGLLPGVQTFDSDLVPDYHAAYLRTYVERDVRQVLDASDWQLFGRFVRLAAALTAQQINHSQLGRELGLTPQTARRWLGSLNATFQWFEVPAYASDAIKRVSKKPKGYFADTGFACFLQAISSPVALGGHPLLGPLFETLVAAEVRKQCALLAPRPNLFHWSTYSGAEVDLLVERDGRLHPIEIKASSRVGRRHTTGISAFRRAHPNLEIAPGLVVAPTENFARVSDHDYALPFDIGPRQ